MISTMALPIRRRRRTGRQLEIAGGPDAEAYGYRFFGEFADAADQILGIGRHLFACAGDACAGNGVDKACRGFGDQLKAFVCAGRGGEEDSLEVVCFGGADIVGGFFDGEVE